MTASSPFKSKMRPKLSALMSSKSWRSKRSESHSGGEPMKRLSRQGSKLSNFFTKRRSTASLSSKEGQRRHVSAPHGVLSPMCEDLDEVEDYEDDSRPEARTFRTITELSKDSDQESIKSMSKSFRMLRFSKDSDIDSLKSTSTGVRSPKTSKDSPKTNISKSFRMGRLSKESDADSESHRSFLNVSGRFIREADSKDSDAHHKHRSLPRTPSKLRLLFSKEKPSGNNTPTVVMTDEMIRLETLIQSDKGKQKLILKLLGVRGDSTVKVRFCSAVDRVDAAVEEKDRSYLAQSLITTFLEHGCMFFISSVSEPVHHAIVVEGHVNRLLDAKREVLEELSKNPEVMRVVDYVEGLDLEND